MNNIKKSIGLTLLVVIVCASSAAGQTRRRTPAPRRTRRTNPVRPARAPIAPCPPASSAVTTPTGLTYVINRRGEGRQLKAGDTVIVHYTGLLTDGAKFDSSLDRGEPIAFELGAGRVIKGWDEGIARLRIGDQATLIIPPQLGYGVRGAGGGAIPPGATLIFVVEVVGVKEATPLPATAPNGG